MKREIIKIDEEKCNGCGLCIPSCHEGALQIIDGKARLISDLMCDGLGACINHCPEGAMEIEMREAEPYDEVKVMKEMVTKGRNVVVAHMKHLKDHGEFVFLKQAATFLIENEDKISFPVKEVIQEVHSLIPGNGQEALHDHAPSPVAAARNTHLETAGPAVFQGGGCPGSRSMTFTPPTNGNYESTSSNTGSRLAQWPVQMHLINPQAAHFRGSDLLLAADCVAYSTGDFHNRFLNGKTLAIACPKLDSNKEVYMQKLVHLINESSINTLTVMIMEVPCCAGLEQMARMAVDSADRKIPLKSVTVGIRGEILEEAWL
jgi:NAD-dependent dihydropyrimidine dehydrogenase PreA subunit